MTNSKDEGSGPPQGVLKGGAPGTAGLNLLTDPLLRVETTTGLERLTLPGLLAALGEDSVEALIGIQRHQEEAFHVFLCSLATTILARRGDSYPRQDEGYWREGLRMLAGGSGDDAWTLVVDDLGNPAFMQPPLPKSDHARLKPLAASPDTLDLLPTAKNHDLKQSRAVCNTPDEWVYALVNLQTMSGYFGRGNPGIARMNSGFGNRPIVELLHSPRSGARWRDAVARLLNHRQTILEGPWGYEPDGLALLWVEPWDGKRSRQLAGLDPNHIEIARRVRLQVNDGRLTALGVPSNSNRLDAKTLNGIVGDAWLPIDLGVEKKGGKPPEAKALTVSPKGLTADLLRRLIFTDGIEMTALQRPIEGRGGDLWLSVSVLVRGQGTTNGYHERHIHIPATQRPRLFGPTTSADPLADLARNTIATAGDIQNRVLKPAVFLFLEGAPEQIKYDRDAAQAWWEKLASRYTHLWSDAYFPWLWKTPQAFDIDDRLDEWRLFLRDRALSVLHHVFQSQPRHSGRYWHARTAAERVFFGAFYKQFPHLKEQDHARTTSA